MKLVYAAGYEVDLGAHVFPTAKYGRLVRLALERGLVTPADIVTPEPARWEDLALVHTHAYLEKVRTGRLSIGEIAQLELPWSPEIVEGFRLATGGTIEAGRLALADGLAMQVGGGLHHAFADHGEGFCLFNDVAVAVRVLRREGRCRRVAIVDCDVHQGNGTAAVFRTDPDVFTLSIHQANNYPAEKPPSTLDVHLPDGTGDAAYLRHLEEALPAVVAWRPDLVYYLAGADPFVDDQLGGLSLSFQGLRARDACVFRTCRRAGVPVAVTLAGGYARRLEDTVRIHLGTLEEALSVEREDRAAARAPDPGA
jgi:acetoin utilization deacetylase AcuC-like enzyme